MNLSEYRYFLLGMAVGAILMVGGIWAGQEVKAREIASNEAERIGRLKVECSRFTDEIAHYVCMKGK